MGFIHTQVITSEYKQFVGLGSTPSQPKPINLTQQLQQGQEPELIAFGKKHRSYCSNPMPVETVPLDPLDLPLLKDDIDANK